MGRTLRSSCLVIYLLFEVSENTICSETQKMGELQRQADQAAVKEMLDEKSRNNKNAANPRRPMFCMAR